MLLLACNAGLMILGSWSFHARALTTCCGSLCLCLNLVAIIAAAVLRFNEFGRLAALCTSPSKYHGYNKKFQLLLPFSDKTTFAGDAELISWLLVAQTIFCFSQCCGIFYTV